MAATNPFRVSDLIAKYGWQVMPYLSNLGPTLLAEAQVLFVDSGHTNASDADDTEHGHSFERPLATIDYAIGLCTGGERSVILVAPGHNEELGDAQIDFDVSDITIIGIGEGSNKPRIDFDHANASVDIGANNVHLVNLTFMPAITDVLVGVDIETGVTGTILEKCDWEEGENAADEFILCVDVKASCEGITVKDCLFRTKVAAAGCTNAIQLNDASDNIIVQRCRFLGNWSNAAINGITTLSTDVLIDDVTIKVADSATGIKMYTGTTGIIRNACLEVTNTAIDSMIVADAMAWFNNYGVTADGTAAAVVGGGEVFAALDLAVAAPTAGSLRDILNDGVGGGYSKATDSLEAIRTKLDTYSSPTDVTAAVPDSPTNKSLQDILSKADGSNNFSKATDSLEAIRDHLDGATVLGGLQLDHLAQTVSAGTNYPTEVTTNSILGMIMSTNGNPDQFNKTTDSLEAISVAVAGISDNVTTAVAATPTASSVQDILQKDATQDYNRTTDSLEAISDKCGGFTMDGGADQDDSVKASLDLAHTDIDAILADTITISGATLPANPTADSLARFVASGGTALGQQLPDSMSLVDIIGNYTGAYDGSSAGNNVKADIDLAKTEIDKIVADVGDFSARTNLQTLLAVLGNPDTAGYTSWSNIRSIHTIAVDGSSVPVANTLSDILHKDGNYTYDNTSDSLEAIADSLIVAIGSPAAGSALDILKKLHYVADGTDGFPATVADDSVLAKIMGVGDPASVSTYNNTTDSLQAIRDYIAGTTALDAINLDHLCLTGTGVAADGELDGHITAQSILGHIMAIDADPSSYNATSDSLQAIGADADAILADTAVLEPPAERIATFTKTGLDAATGDTTIFTIANGPVRVIELVGIVTNTLEGAANFLYKSVPTSPGADVSISTATAVDNQAAGTTISTNATFGGATVVTTNGTIGVGCSFIQNAGIIEMNLSGNLGADDEIKFYIRYQPLLATAVVTGGA